MPGRLEKVKRYNLVTGEDTYASQTAQNPSTSRLLRGFIPYVSGELRREQPLTTFAPPPARSQGGIVWLFEYDHNDANDTVIRDFFCVTGPYTEAITNNPIPYSLYRLVSGNWTYITDLAGIPQAVVINNVMHFSDGQVSWLFDGTTWNFDGFDIPQFTPTIAVQAGGGLDVLTNRFYWITFADHTPGRVHESSSSPISLGSSNFTNSSVKVQPCAGTVSSTGNTIVKVKITGAGGTNKVVSSIARASNIVTVTTSTAHGFGVDWMVNTAGVTDASFDGTFFILSVPSSTTFTYAQSGVDATSSGGTVSGALGFGIAPA